MPRTLSDRILDAARTCIARVGVAKTTLDDVAREAGCARATLYRCFPGKQQVLAALVTREIAAIGAEVVHAADDAANLCDATVSVITTAAHALTQHGALTFVATHESEVLIPYLAFERENAVLHAGARLVAPAFARHLSEVRALRLAEWVVRMTLSYLCCPSEHFDVLDATQVRTLVDEFVLPGIARSESATTIGGSQ
jgi:AcrR family transcriptional regulator